MVTFIKILVKLLVKLLVSIVIMKIIMKSENQISNVRNIPTSPV